MLEGALRGEERVLRGGGHDRERKSKAGQEREDISSHLVAAGVDGIIDGAQLSLKRLAAHDARALELVIIN